MKCFVLYINRDADYYTAPTLLNGISTRTYGTAMWNPEMNRQICRVPQDQWSMAMEEDVLKLSHLRGNVWLRAVEFEAADGGRFLSYQKALDHETEVAPAPVVQQIIPSGIPVTIEAVEKAGSQKLRDLARQSGMPGFRKLPKSDDLRPALVAFLRSQQPPVVVEENKAEAV